MKNKIIFGALALVVIIAGILMFWEKSSGVKINLEELEKKYPDKTAFINEIKEAQNKVEEEPGSIQLYTFLGLAWKSLADATADSEIYNAARQVYEQGIKLTEGRNSLFILNAGDMASLAKKYDLAEKYYLRAINDMPSEIDSYLSLGRLYQAIGKSKEEIVAVYDKGINIVVPPTNLLIEKAGYLRDAGLYKEAAEAFEEVLKFMPDSGVIKQEIENLKSKAAAL